MSLYIEALGIVWYNGFVLLPSSLSWCILWVVRCWRDLKKVISTDHNQWFRNNDLRKHSVMEVLALPTGKSRGSGTHVPLCSEVFGLVTYVMDDTVMTSRTHGG